jgi:hypothetical protein
MNLYNVSATTHIFPALILQRSTPICSETTLEEPKKVKVKAGVNLVMVTKMQLRHFLPLMTSLKCLTLEQVMFLGFSLLRNLQNYGTEAIPAQKKILNYLQFVICVQDN